VGASGPHHFLMKLIGITGQKQSGKDTATTALCQIGYKPLRFAGILKEMTQTFLEAQGVDPGTIFRMIDGDLKEMPSPNFCGKTARHAMQTLGTEWGRDCIDQNVWVTATLEAAKDFPLVVISDVRFENEAQAIRDAGGTLVRIVRDGCNGDGHVSETEMANLKVDFEVSNNGTIEQLQEIIKALAQGI
jgi:Deoxynucleotide monophosphate kinase